MKWFVQVFSLLSVLILAGCRPQNADTAHHEEAELLGPQFSAKRGLLVPEDTRRSMDLKIVEVAEKQISARLEIQLRVYQIGENSSLASGFLSTEQAERLQGGERISIETDTGRNVSAQIRALDNSLRKVSGMIELLVEIPRSAFQPAIGAFVEASVTLDAGEGVLTIPLSALLECSDGYAVYAVNGEHFVRTLVQVGVTNADLVEIKDGLYPGDQVVSQPVRSLWLTELAAVKGGQACCVMPAEGTGP
jgi:multidrug efflux pump subunit AcrA (membrane-fusion protein)